MNIGTIYRPVGDYDKALEYYYRALIIATELGNKKTIAQVYGNMGVVYYEQKNYKSSIVHEQKALELFEVLNDLDNIAWVLANIGDNFAEIEDFKKAFQYHERALRINRELNNRSYIANSLENVGRMYYQLALNEKNVNAREEYIQNSIRNYKEAIDILTDLKDYDYLAHVYRLLYETEIFSGNYEQAEKSLHSFLSYTDSILTLDNKVKLANLTTDRAEHEKKQQVELTRLMAQKRRNEAIVLTGGILLLLVVTGFVIKERRKSEKLLLNILPAEVADELKRKGNADARHFDEVTVLFTDFVNFTALTEKLSPQMLVDELHTYFKAFDNIVSKYNIEKIKTVGDAYLAVCGLPVADKKHAVNVVNAAIEILDFVQSRKSEKGEHTFDIRIGVHSGSVVAGIVGVKKFSYDVWGDTVNTAARMEQSSESGRINISQTTYDLVKDKFTCIYRGELDAKNKGLMAMYFVEGLKA